MNPAVNNQPIHQDHALTMPHFVRKAAELYPDRTAIVFGDHTWTYRELYRDVRRCEAALVGLGATKGTRIALIVGTRPEWIVSTFAIMSIGAVAIPLSTYEPSVKLHGMLRHSDASIVLCQDRLLRHRYLEDLLRAFPGLTDTASVFLDPAIPNLRTIIRLGEGPDGPHITSWDALMSGSTNVSDEFLDRLEAEVHPMDDSVIIYTSGTTGPSKGVIHTHRGLAVQFDRIPEQFTLTSDDVVWGTYPLFWSAGLAWVLGGTFGAGATLVLEEYFDADASLALIAQHGATCLHLTPSQAVDLVNAIARKPVELPRVRLLPYGPLSIALGLDPNHPAPGASLGLSEAMTLACSIPWDSPIELRKSTNGLPLPGMSLKIVDPNTGAELGADGFGEIAIKGTAMMRGYHKVFPEQYLDEDGYYLTKDGGTVDSDGYLHFEGRLSGVIRTSSANVAPAEVEAALMGLPGVRIASAVGLPDERVGERIVACVACSPGVSTDEATLRTALREQLAGYKIPTRIIFVDERDFPLTATGKPIPDRVKSLVTERLSTEKAPVQHKVNAR